MTSSPDSDAPSSLPSSDRQAPCNQHQQRHRGRGVVVTKIFRVVVRGQFAELDHETRERLVAEAPEHDIFKSAFTTDGTFTYDPALVWFNLRYETRVADEHAGTDPPRRPWPRRSNGPRRGSPMSASATSTCGRPPPIWRPCGSERGASRPGLCRAIFGSSGCSVRSECKKRRRAPLIEVYEWGSVTRRAGCRRRCRWTGQPVSPTRGCGRRS